MVRGRKPARAPAQLRSTTETCTAIPDEDWATSHTEPSERGLLHGSHSCYSRTGLRPCSSSSCLVYSATVDATCPRSDGSSVPEPHPTVSVPGMPPALPATTDFHHSYTNVYSGWVQVLTKLTSSYPCGPAHSSRTHVEAVGILTKPFGDFTERDTCSGNFVQLDGSSNGSAPPYNRLCYLRYGQSAFRLLYG